MYISLEVYLQYFPSIHVKSMNVLGTEFSPNFEFSLTEYHYYLLRHLQSTFANSMLKYLFIHVLTILVPYHFNIQQHLKAEGR